MDEGEAEAARQRWRSAHVGAIATVVAIVLLAVMGALAPVTIVVADPPTYAEVRGPGGVVDLLWLAGVPIAGGLLAAAAWAIAILGWRPWRRQPRDARVLRMHNALLYGPGLLPMMAASFTRLLVPETATITGDVLVDIHSAPARVAATFIVTLLTMSIGYAIAEWAIAAWLRRTDPERPLWWMEARSPGRERGEPSATRA